MIQWTVYWYCEKGQLLVRGISEYQCRFGFRSEITLPIYEISELPPSTGKVLCQLLAAKSWNSFPSLWASNFASVIQRKLRKKWCDWIRKQLVKALIFVNDCHTSFYILLTSRWYICIELSFSPYSDPHWRSGFVHTAHWRAALVQSPFFLLLEQLQ